MAIKVQGTTVIDDARHISNIGVATVGILSANQITTDGSTNQSGVGVANYVLTSGGTSGDISWQPVTAVGSGTLDGINILEEGSQVGTAGSVINVNFVGNNVTATGVALGLTATVTISDDPTYNSLNVTGDVGINSTTPTAKLDVNGDVAIASTVSIGTTVDIIPYNDLGMLSFEGSQGQLFAITNNLSSGSIFSVNPISGIPIIDIHADRTIQLNPYGGNTGIGTTNPTAKLDVNGTLNVSGVSTFASDIHLGDDDKLRFGDGNDLEIYHNAGNASYIRDVGTGNLNIDSTGGNIQIRVNGSESAIIAKQNNAVELYYDAVKKFETTADGIKVHPNVGLGTTAGNSQDLASFETTNSNGSKLRIVEERDINGTNWTSAYTRIQKTIDVTDQAYIQFNGDGLNYGIELGNAVNGEIYAQFKQNSSVDLYHDGTKKFETTGIGVSIVGTGNTATITGPSNLVLDPGTVGDNTGTVTILGNLQVDGTQTVINSTTMTVDDLNITLASGAGNTSAANGAGITVDGASATLTYFSTTDSWEFNKDLILDKTDATLKIKAGATGTRGGVDFTFNTDSTVYGSLEIDYDQRASEGLWLNTGNYPVTIESSPSHYIKFRSGTTEHMRIKSGGNVGIGTDNPQQKLHVKGVIQVDGTSAAINGNYSRIYQNSSGVVDYGLQLKHYQGDTNDADAAILIGGDTSSREGNIVFYRDVSGTTTETARFDEDGDFGIGTNDPTHRLTVNGSGTNTGTTIARFRNNSGSNRVDIIDENLSAGRPAGVLSPSATYGLGLYAGGGPIRFYPASTTAEKVRIDNSGNLLINTTSATGTSSQPLQVSGGAYVNGSFGIGSTNPVGLTPGSSNTLHLNGTSAVVRVGPYYSSGGDRDNILLVANSQNTYIRSNNEKFSFYNSSGDIVFHGTSDAENVRFTAAGDVGIGTTAPGSTLAVGGTITELYNGTFWNVVTQADVGYGASQVPLNQYLGQLAFLDDFHPNGLRRDGGGSDDVVVSSGGLVGIGTDNPNRLLTLKSTNPIISLTDYDAGGEFYIQNSSGSGILNADFFRILTNSSSEVVRISSAGNVGIGTDDPDSKLTVAADSANAQIEIKRTNTNASGTVGAINFTALDGHSVANISAVGDGDDEGAHLVFRTTSAAGENSPFGGSTIERLRITSNGNVGIGTANPQADLHIESAGPGIRLSDTGNSSAYAYFDANAANAIIHADKDNQVSNSRVAFAVDNDEKVRITSAGNVGIGTDDPAAKLDVNGDVAIASTVGIGTRIDLIPYDTIDNGTLSFEGSAGQLFSITNNLSSGSIFSVNDVSGIPSIDVDADGTIQLAPYGSTENVGIGTTNPTTKVDVIGTVKATSFESTVASGTAPLVVASNTVVANLNADLLDGQEGSYYTNASNLASGTVPDARFPATLPAASGANLTSLNADNLASGTVAIARGGTNSSATPTNGGIAYGTGSAYAFTAAGTSGQVLTSSGAGAPTWAAAAGGGSGTFDTGITTSIYVSVNSGVGTNVSETNDIFVGPDTAYTFPSTAGKKYVIESIHFTNTFNNEIYLTARHDFNGGLNVPIAQRVIVPYQGATEFLDQPIIANPSDVFKFQALDGTDSAATGIDGGLDAFIVYSEKDDTDYIGTGKTVSTAAGTEIFQASSNPAMLQSIKLCNYSLNSDIDASISIYNGGLSSGTRLGYLVYNLTVPKNSVIEILEKPKYLATNAAIVGGASAANVLGVTIAGKYIT